MKDKMKVHVMGDSPPSRDWVEVIEDRYVMIKHPNGLEMRVTIEEGRFSLLFMTNRLSSVNITPVSGNVVSIGGRDE
jgi:hypothetical protein